MDRQDIMRVYEGYIIYIYIERKPDFFSCCSNVGAMETPGGYAHENGDQFRLGQQQ